ncbi:cupin domain-containing protein [Parapusillimonas sp. SGNA-6]|nr:cupin domain-containing protein [Parapusillimonas sp. SGNA-6]
MNIDEPLPLLGGLTPQEFMTRYWQREPLLIRQAIPNYVPSLSIADLRELAKREEVESRLIWREGEQWNMKTGPFRRLPPARQPAWTLLCQSVDLHDDATADLMRQFRFISDARLDDAMISIASDTGGVGPHFDSYDVFLLQAHGQRRWRISRQQDLTLEPGLPLKILRHFVVEEEYVLEPGDMLYLPPHVAHDGIAIGDCMTISIGFRAPTQAGLACGMLDAATDQIMANLGDLGGLYALPVIPGPVLSETYGDAGTSATSQPAAIPRSLLQAALTAVKQVDFSEALATRFLGISLTELSPNALFEASCDEDFALAEALPDGKLVLDRCTRMMYRDDALFINGEVAPVPASTPMRRLADERELQLDAATAAQLDAEAQGALESWMHDGWVHYVDD